MFTYIDHAIKTGITLLFIVVCIILLQGYLNISNNENSKYLKPLEESLSKVLVKNENLNTSKGNFYENNLTREDFVNQHVLFPDIHLLILFKETSFCSNEKRDKIRPTLCSYDWGHLFNWDFNPHNYGGIKKPKWRKTTCLESIGEYVTRLVYQGYLDGDDPDIKYLMNDPHCIYESKEAFAKDVYYLQNAYFKNAKKNYPNKFGKFRKLSDLSEEDYIDLLKTVGYNPYDKYYYAASSGLYYLLNEYNAGRFQEKYEHIYNKRMKASFY